MMMSRTNWAGEPTVLAMLLGVLQGAVNPGYPGAVPITTDHIEHQGLLVLQTAE